ncbi:Dual specificity phosphatase ibp1 [Malassezia restricta CBS 7877]|uniref:Dual specificity phosphatase ibp1 n=2 Tax=Malassezia restricta TaxID=76775 RepID=A0A3G2S5Q6_MALR7|nr:Dual specificity phosphatase ibp1 [Malassezia restricta CBS 7877]
MSFQPPYMYIEADALASKLKEQRPSTAVVDVRDDDFEGGHIKGAFHSPSSTFLDGVNTLLKPLETYENVVFHCALSQQRGPKAARIYREIRDANIEAGRMPPTTQQVYVLRDGFSHFGNKFKRDPELVEDWDEEAWQFR